MIRPGRLFFRGLFSGTVDFDPNAGTASLTSGGGRDAFLGRYTTDGAYMWIGNISGTAEAQIRDIVCTPTTVYVTGLFYGTADFGFGSGFNSQTSSGANDVFIAGYLMSDGSINSIRIIGSAVGEDYGYSIATDASSNIYVTGVYNGTVNFGNTNLTSTGNMDMFCAKYTSTLSPVWAVSSGVNATNDFGKSITVDGLGNVYITGSWYTGVWIQNLTPRVSHNGPLLFVSLEAVLARAKVSLLMRMGMWWLQDTLPVVQVSQGYVMAPIIILHKDHPIHLLRSIAVLMVLSNG
ncbi:MAG: SBBP repeat-containing protein [Cyclobacteriaceae bacterium]|nr:MAG: SBBP repeat-containing protein [Cyclobacteriaceae bacterium]